jgi:stage II sporulation protein D
VVGSEVMLYGKGFGHGVGLCQEGAMQMAKKGYSFDQILQYYYPGASLTK